MLSFLTGHATGPSWSFSGEEWSERLPRGRWHTGGIFAVYFTLHVHVLKSVRLKGLAWRFDADIRGCKPIPRHLSSQMAAFGRVESTNAV
jgi:hypothetical protein